MGKSGRTDSQHFASEQLARRGGVQHHLHDPAAFLFCHARRDPHPVGHRRDEDQDDEDCREDRAAGRLRFEGLHGRGRVGRSDPEIADEPGDRADPVVHRDRERREAHEDHLPAPGRRVRHVLEAGRARAVATDEQQAREIAPDHARAGIGEVGGGLDRPGLPRGRVDLGPPVEDGVERPDRQALQRGIVGVNGQPDDRVAVHGADQDRDQAGAHRDGGQEERGEHKGAAAHPDPVLAAGDETHVAEERAEAMRAHRRHLHGPSTMRP